MNKSYSKEFIEEIKTRFPDVSVEVYAPRRTYLLVPWAAAYDISKFLFSEKKMRLSTATGLDTRDGIEIIYHFSHDESGTYYSVRAIIPKDNLKIKSLTDFLPAANWIEREIHELLGVDFAGHPNLAPLLTSEDWPKDAYPLRRDYPKESK